MNPSTSLNRYQTRLLRSSIKTLSPLTINYVDIEGQPTERTVTPLPDEPAHNGLFVAWCHLREDIRNFRLDRITRARKARRAPKVDTAKLAESRVEQQASQLRAPEGPLPEEQRELLEQAIEQGTPVSIIYSDTAGHLSERTITPIDSEGPRPHLFVAWCHLRDAERNFAYERVLYVEASDEKPRVPDSPLSSAQLREMIDPRHDNFRLDHTGPGAWVGSAKLSELDRELLKVASGKKEDIDGLMELIYRGDYWVSQLAFELGRRSSTYTDDEGTTVVSFPAAAFTLGVRYGQMSRVLDGLPQSSPDYPFN